MNRFKRLLALLLLPVAVSTCGKDDEKSAAPAGTKTGCLQGVVMDGLTGARIALPRPSKQAGVKVLVRSDFKDANPLVVGDKISDDKKNLLGEYALCDVPLDTYFPIFVWVDGYLPFSSTVFLASSRSSASGQAEKDIERTAPTSIANVRLYKKGADTQDYEVTVSYNGGVVEGATVVLRPSGSNVVAQGSGFLTPSTTFQKTMVGVTSAEGKVKFAAADLVLGGTYSYQVIPPKGGEQLTTATGTLSVGLKTTLTEHPFKKVIGLRLSVAPLAIESYFPTTDEYVTDGTLTFNLNRAVEVVPGSEDSLTATLHYASQATLETNVADNDKAEQARVEINGRQVKIFPNFKKAPDQSKEPGVSISYTGLLVRPVDSPRRTEQLALSGTVSIFGGERAPSRADTIEIVSGDEQRGVSNSSLAQPLIVRVLDQFGEPLVGGLVNFTVTAGGGALSTGLATTDALGQATTMWTLGENGDQTVTATSGALTPVEFTANFDLMIASGNNQTGWRNQELDLPLLVKVFDADNNPLAGETVTFAIATGDGTVNGTGAEVTSVNVTTDADGQAQVTWTLGQLSTQRVSATWTGKTVMFNVVVVTRTMSIVTASNNQTGTASTELADPIQVLVTSSTGDPVAGVRITFAVADTMDGSGLSLTMGGAYTATVTATTDATGIAKAYWKLGTASATTYTVTAAPENLSRPELTFTADAS